MTPQAPAAAGPRRVRVQGDYFHGQVPPGALYVGRAAPGLPASPYANPFRAGGLIREPGPGGGPACPYRGHLAPGTYTDTADGRRYQVRRVTGRSEAVTLFAAHAAVTWPREQIRRDLGGRDLACWCPLAEPCHADVLLLVSNDWGWPALTR